MVGHELWLRRYGGDPGLVGNTIQIDGQSCEVVGIMPEGFSFPDDGTALWLPARIDAAQAPAAAFAWSSIARLAPGVPIEQAEAQLASFVARMPETYAGQAQFVAFLQSGQLRASVHALKEDVIGDVQRPLWILMGTVGFVLLIACANVANLCLVRAEARRREYAVRAALGAGRSVLARQHLAESVLLAAAGGALGLLIAWGGLWGLVRLAPSNLPRLNEIGIGGTVLGFNVAVTLGSALLFGLAPALKRVTPAMLGSLIQSGTRSSASGGRLLIRNALVVAQTALALVLLIGSALLVRSFWEIRSVYPGFDPEGVLTFRISLPPAEFRQQTVAAAFHQDLLDRINGLPGVFSTGAVQFLPLGGSRRATSFIIEEGPLSESEMAPQFWFASATPGYFESMQIPLVAGRTFERRDNEAALGSVVVSASMAEHLWPNGDPLGKRVRAAADGTPWFTVVGVVGDVRSHGLRLPPPETIYLPLVGPGADGPSTRSLSYTVRAENPLGLVQAIRGAVGELNPDLPIAGVESMERIVARSEARLSFTMVALALAAGLALILGAVGLYGVLAYVVSQRRHEIGVRLTLGADAGVVQKMVVFQGARLALCGIGIGVAGAVGLTRFLRGLLYATPHLDLVAFATTSALLLGVGLLASYVPARRAAAVDPMMSLRSDD